MEGCLHGNVLCSEGCHDMVPWEPAKMTFLKQIVINEKENEVQAEYVGMDEFLCWMECLANGEEFYVR